MKSSLLSPKPAEGGSGNPGAPLPLPPSPASRPSPAARPVLEKVRIGGAVQWLSIRTHDLSNPILLFLHGGPGTSQLASNRRNTAALEQFFTVVDWDQRGAGKSYAAIAGVQRMHIDQFVEDTVELTRYLLKRFGQQRLVLAGHSWGSVIGALTVSKYPWLYHCYVGIGQVAAMEAGELASYRWTLEQARQRQEKKAIRALETMGPPPYKSNWQANTMKQRSYVARFGGEIHDSRYGALGLVLRSVLFAREYTLRDRLNFFRGIFGSMKLLWPQLMKIDLFERVPEMRLPVFFMEGKFDHEVPAEIAARYFDHLEAPAKTWIWFEKSAHFPNAEEPERFTRIMVDKVLPLCRQARPAMVA
jgi:pimeloyl-ACP methyl ester carboxylesterase